MNSPDESIEQLRVRILRRAVEAFGDEGQARDWLRCPNRVLGGQVPASLLETPDGVEQVLDELGRIESGDLYEPGWLERSSSSDE